MFVPYIFTVEPLPDYAHLIVFYKYVDMIKCYGWPIIAHERSFSKIDDLMETGILTEDSISAWSKLLEYTIPTQEDIDITDQYFIPEKLEQNISIFFLHKLKHLCFYLTTTIPRLKNYWAVCLMK
jgi:hypothetical protein